MPRTHFQDFKRDDGSPVTVEYSATGGESNFDHPGHICDGGGSGPEIMILNVWPNTPEYDAMIRERQSLEESRLGKSILSLARGSESYREAMDELEHEIARAEDACQLTDAERERMETWLIEHYVDEPEEPDIVF